MPWSKSKVSTRLHVLNELPDILVHRMVVDRPRREDALADVVRSVKLGVSGIFHAPFTAEGLNELLTQISRQRHPR